MYFPRDDYSCNIQITSHFMTTPSTNNWHRVLVMSYIPIILIFITTLWCQHCFSWFYKQNNGDYERLTYPILNSCSVHFRSSYVCISNKVQWPSKYFHCLLHFCSYYIESKDILYSTVPNTETCIYAEMDQLIRSE